MAGFPGTGDLSFGSGRAPSEDSLTLQVQALQEAKTLAAAQARVAMQQIQTRQEVLWREAQQALQRAKEMQQDLDGISSLGAGTSLGAPGSSLEASTGTGT